ncbi:MAG TPA: DUF4097 family beta strand repeat-containing protein [Caulobacteraceae bacterium]|nr:DUF4097 family beta strand repeat-containing protein [Caulobacteraceae bacterium]
MNVRNHSFETPGPARLRIEIPNGQIVVTTAETQVTDVELSAPQGDSGACAWVAEAEIAQIGDEIVVRGPRVSLSLFRSWGPIHARIKTPLGGDACLSIGAGGIETHGRMGKVTANTGAGAVRLDDCAEAHARTGAGNVEIASVTGSVETKTGAGRVTVGKVGGNLRVATAAGNAKVGDIAGWGKFTTAHGNVEVDRAGDGLDVFTASGNVEVHRADRGRVRAKTVSGRVTVGVPTGVAALLDISTLSGRVHSDLAASGAPGDDEAQVELILSTVSGNVNVARA